MTDSHTYDRDFVAWTDSQATALRRRAANEIDWENVAEEIESLGRSDRREIRSRLKIICTHLLKWAFQPDARSASWRASIRDSRYQIAELIDESPSLTDYPATQLAGVYTYALLSAIDETGIGNLPEACPWTIDQVLDPTFWPDC